MNQAAAGAPAAVRMNGIAKSFGGIRALENVDLVVERGEIHALLGENGAGKSTMLKILRGVLQPDRGTIEINGRRLTDVSAGTARRAGVAMIFQEMSLIPTLSVAQNIFLNHEARNGFGLIDDGEAESRARRLFAELGVDVDPTAIVGALGTGQRQLTEIVKAISQDAGILLLDEPTSALSGEEVERLFSFLRRLKSEGAAIIYVSHRMDEIARIADRATIFRDGRHIVTAPMSELTLEQIIAHIVGRRAGIPSAQRRVPPNLGEPILTLHSVSGPFKPNDVSLTLRRGEILGIAGLLGSGRSSLARVISGIDPIASGEIRVCGRRLDAASARDAMAAGIVLIPEDRVRQGVIMQHSIENNISLPALDRLTYWSWLTPAKSTHLAEEQIVKLRIKAASAQVPVSTLSGGNQQKVVLAKWLAMNPDILVLDEPTAGIDVGSKSEIVALVRALAQNGKAIIFISSELSELLAVSDRIAVMAGGRLVRDIARDDLERTAAGPAPSDAEHKLQLALQQARASV